MKKFLSCMLAAAMVSGFAAVPVLAVRTASPTTSKYYIASNTADKMYFEAETFVTETTGYSTNPMKGTTTWGMPFAASGSTAFAGKADDGTGAKTITLQFTSPATGFYSLGIGGSNPFHVSAANMPYDYGKYTININGTDYSYDYTDCTKYNPTSGAVTYEALPQYATNQIAIVNLPSVYIKSGTNTITFTSSSTSSGGNELFIDFLGLEKKGLRKQSSDNAGYYVKKNNDDKMYFEAESIVDSTTTVKTADLSTYGVTYQTPGTYFDVAGQITSVSSEASITLKFNSTKAGIYTLGTAGSNPFSATRSGFDIEVNGKKYTYSIKDCWSSTGAPMTNGDYTSNGWGRAVIPGVEIEEGDNTIIYTTNGKAWSFDANSETKGTEKDASETVLFVDFIGLTRTSKDITVTQPANGTVEVDKAYAAEGDTVTVTATPDEGYELDYITVNGTQQEGNTFTMPANDVTVSAVFKAETVTPAAEDITADAEISGINDDGETYKVGLRFAKALDPQDYKYILFTAGDETRGDEIVNIPALNGISGDAIIAIILDHAPSRNVTAKFTNTLPVE